MFFPRFNKKEKSQTGPDSAGNFTFCQPQLPQTPQNLKEVCEGCESRDLFELSSAHNGQLVVKGQDLQVAVEQSVVSPGAANSCSLAFVGLTFPQWQAQVQVTASRMRPLFLIYRVLWFWSVLALNADFNQLAGCTLLTRR